MLSKTGKERKEKMEEDGVTRGHLQELVYPKAGGPSLVLWTLPCCSLSCSGRDACSSTWVDQESLPYCTVEIKTLHCRVILFNIWKTKSPFLFSEVIKYICLF